MQAPVLRAEFIRKKVVLASTALFILALPVSSAEQVAAKSEGREKQDHPSLLVLSDHTAATVSKVEFSHPPNIRGQSAWIPLRYQDQETNLCVPTSASIILDYFGEQVSPRQLKELSMGRQYSPDSPFHDFIITLFRDLISGLHRIGYSWKEEDYPDDRNGLREGLSDIERSLDAGMPVMIDTTRGRGYISAVAGHTFVVAGYSVPQQALFVMDPNLPSPGAGVVTFQQLEGIWNSRSVNFDERAAVFPQRRRGKK